MAVTIWPRPQWPFTLSVTVEYALGPAGLVVTTTAENTGDSDAPYASGHHPYLTVGTETIDTAEVHLAARTYFPTDPDQIPTGRAEVAGHISPRPLCPSLCPSNSRTDTPGSARPA